MRTVLVTRDQLIVEVIRLQILGHGQGLTCLYVTLHTRPAYSSLISLVRDIVTHIDAVRRRSK